MLANNAQDEEPMVALAARLRARDLERELLHGYRSSTNVQERQAIAGCLQP